MLQQRALWGLLTLHATLHCHDSPQKHFNTPTFLNGTGFLVKGSALTSTACGPVGFASTAKVLAECKLKYYRISECVKVIALRAAGAIRGEDRARSAWHRPHAGSRPGHCCMHTPPDGRRALYNGR